MKVLLIDPPGANKGLNTGLGYLAGALAAGGRDDAFVLDLNNWTPGRLGDPNQDVSTSTWMRELETTLTQFRPELVGVSVKTFTSPIANQIVTAVRGMRPWLPVVLGGPHVTLDAATYVEETGAQIGVIGEGEATLLETCRALEQGRPLGDIEGIVYRDGETVRSSQQRPVLRDLDKLSLPNYGAFSSVQRTPSLLLEYPLLTSRGCPFNCSYCSMPTLMGRRWRARSPENVLNELRMAVEQIGSTSFTIVDDNFTLETKRAEAICDALIQNGLSMPWSSQNGLRADRLTPGLIAKMRQSGCYYVWIGIETGDEQVFESIEKGEKLEDVKAGVRALQAAGIKVGGFFIIGLPGATRQSDLKSLALAQSLGIEAWWFNFVPYRFTRAGEWVGQHATPLQKSAGMPQYGKARIEPVFETPEYTREERIATYQEVHVRMGYFERLANPNASWTARASHLATIVPRYGIGPTFSLAGYLLAGLSQKVLSKTGLAPIPPVFNVSGLAARSSINGATATAPKAASQNLIPRPTRPLEGK